MRRWFLNLLLEPQKLCSCSEDVLGSSLRVLDLCSVTKDAFLQLRASGRDLESSLRRRDTDVSSKIRSYLICKNKVEKMISKCFSSTKKSGSNKSSETLSTVRMLREVEELSITIFESLFSSVGTARSKRVGLWLRILHHPSEQVLMKKIWVNFTNCRRIWKL